MRCRPGIVTHTAFAKVPDQRCTASLPLALHRIRDTWEGKCFPYPSPTSSSIAISSGRAATRSATAPAADSGAATWRERQ